MPGRNKIKRVVMSGPKGEPCFYFSSGNIHISDCCKIMVSLRRRELLNQCDVGIPACAFHGEVDHGQRRRCDVFTITTGEGYRRRRGVSVP